MKICSSVFLAALFGVFITVQSAVNVTQCDNGWTYFDASNSCYWAGDHQDFPAAESSCVSLGGHLASIHNSFENTFISSLTETGEKQKDSEMTWIGLHIQDGAWKWTDGSPTVFAYWMYKDPNDMKKLQCVELLQDDLGNKRNTKGQWHNVHCGTKMRKYICQKKPNY